MMPSEEEGLLKRFHRRTFLKLGIAASAATAVGVFAFRREVSPAPAPDAYRDVYEAEDFWGMIASRDQLNEPVTTGWTWGNRTLWQVPRRSEDVIGASAFSQGASAVTCVAGNEIWQDINVPCAGNYKIFLRIVDYRRTGINAVTVNLDEQSRRVQWGSGWLSQYAAKVTARMRRVHDYLGWVEAGSFDLRAGAQRLTIRADQVGQSLLFIDSVYLTADLNEELPDRWNPLVLSPEPGGKPVKTRRTMRTDAEIATARENVKRFEWAKEELRSVLDVAQPFVELSNEALWGLMPPTTLRRSNDIATRCLEHGSFRDRGGWQVDPFHHPHQLKCPVGGEWQSASSVSEDADESGAYYFYRLYSDHIRPGVEALGKAFVLTGEQTYAKAAAILLVKLAQEYPNGFDKRGSAFSAPYSSGSGTITDNVSAAYDLSSFAIAYDFIFGAIDSDGELGPFLRSRNKELSSGAEVRYYIEERLLRVMAQAVLDSAIVANTGIHDRALMAVALCLDDFASHRYPNSLEMIDWLYYGQNRQGINWSGPRRYLANYLLPDGSIYDASVDYASLALYFIDCFDWMERARNLNPEKLPAARYPSLIRHERLRRHIDFLTGSVCLGRYHPACGDGHGRRLWEGDNLRPRQFQADTATLAYPEYIAKLLSYAADQTLTPLLHDPRKKRAYRDLYTASVEQESSSSSPGDMSWEEIRTDIFDDYGLALLRDGKGEDARVLVFNYDGPQAGHRDFDRMSIGLFAKGLDLMPELTYPKLWALEYLNNFEKHSLLHNTISFDRRSTRFEPGHLDFYHGFPGLQVIGSQSRNGDGSRQIERTCALVDVDDANAYAVDFAYARGGVEHHYSLHGPITKAVTVDGMQMESKAGGTLAGAGLKFGDRLTGPDGASSLHPFCFFTNVARGETQSQYSVDYQLGDERDVHLRVTGVTASPVSLTLADASPPADPDAYSVRYSFIGRSGAEPLTSQFVHVLEPYARTRFVDRVEAIEVHHDSTGDENKPIAIRVTCGSRADTFVLSSADGARVTTSDSAIIEGIYCCYVEENGQLRSVYLSGVAYFQKGEVSLRMRPRATGRLTSADRTANSIVVEGQLPGASKLVGRRIRVFNTYRSRTYEVVRAMQMATGRLKLDLSRSSLLGEGEAVGFEDSVLLNNIPMPHVNAGCTVETSDGISHWMLKGLGHVGHAGADLILESQVSKAALSNAFIKKTIFVYGYGPGDEVELINSAYVDFSSGSNPRIIASDDVELR